MAELDRHARFVPAGIGLLARMKIRALINHTRDILAEAPIKVFATGLFVALIWFALYQLFYQVFRFFQQDLLQSAVAIPLLFNFFFVALLVLLTFSNAIIVYGALFSDEEAAYLLAAPLNPRSTVGIKYLESLFFSSWSLILLGLPLMTAIAAVQDESRFFHPMFIAFFLAFVPIPGAVGLLLAWFVARFLPRSARRILVYAAVVILVFTVVWALRSVRHLHWVNETWIEGFFARLSLIESAVLPSTWVTRGIEAAINDAPGDAVRYIVVTVANALFLSWLAVHIVSHRFTAAFDRARAGRGKLDRPATKTSGGVAGMIFLFLPREARLIAAKDLRTFVRDPLQWSQLAILFGLMALYLANVPRFDIDETSLRWRNVVPFLNLCVVSFILATFTSRFVFPMISLEGNQLWLVGLLPIRRFWILIAKFAFALLVTYSVAAAVMLLASYVLRIDDPTTIKHLLITASICVGLCGFAVGIGARMPMFDQRNPARIANGLGGTINLIASVILISAMLGALGYGLYLESENPLIRLNNTVRWIEVAVISGGFLAGATAMSIGAAHFSRIEV